jgi:hypothetical protein
MQQVQLWPYKSDSVEGTVTVLLSSGKVLWSRWKSSGGIGLPVASLSPLAKYRLQSGRKYFVARDCFVQPSVKLRGARMY